MVGVVISIVPVIGWSWPALAPLMLLGAGALGMKLVLDSRDESPVTVELRRRLLEERSVTLHLSETLSEALFDEVKRGDAMIFEKDGMLLTVAKDERNKLKISVTAPKETPRWQMEKLGTDFANEMAQLFAQNRIVEQLSRLNFEVAEESVDEKGEIVLRVRRYREGPDQTT